MGRLCRDISVLQGILVWSVAILQTTDGSNITWYEPPPLEIVTDDKVIVTSSKNLIKGSLNKELSFNFSLTAGSTIGSVTIGLNGDIVVTYFPSQAAPTVYSAFVGRFGATWVPTKLTLIMINVTSADGGTYRCEVATTGGKRWIRIIEVDVIEVPEIIEVSGFTVREGGSMTLKCLAKGKPTPSITLTDLSDGSNITWTRIPDGSVISRTLWNITRQNASAGYRCTATNVAGNPDTRDVFIDVQYKPDHVSLKVSTNKVCAGTEVLFTCSAGAANPAILNYSLHDKNGAGTVKTSRNQGGVFTLTVTMKGHHIYTCEAANSVGTTVSSSSTVEVQVPASVTIDNDTIVELEGENVTLRCAFSGFPSPNVSWINNSLSYIEDAESILKLSNISRYSDAVYTCSASNACGKESKTVKIDVQYPAEATGRGTEDTVTEGEKKILSCPVDGNPKPNIKWYKGFEASGNPVSNETLLTVENLKESVCYTCFANNSRGTPVNISHCLIVNTTSAPSITTPSNESEVSAGPPWVIIVAVTGGVVVLLIVVGVLTWWVHKQRKCRKDSKIHNSDLERHDGEGGHLQVQGVYAQSGPPEANGTDSAAEQQIEAEAAIPTYAVVDKSKKSKKQADERPPEYAVVDKSQKKEKQEVAATPTYAAVDKSKKKKKKSREEVPAVYAEVDKSKKKKKKKIDDKNLYENLDEPKKEKKPGELLYADLGDFQNPSMPAVSTSPQPLPAIKKADPYERTDYADITQFLKGNATLPPNDGNGDTEMKPKRPSKKKEIQGNDKETPI